LDVPFSEIFDPTALTWSTLSKSTVAAVPGIAGARATHLQCLRRLVDDDGWIRTLKKEAENERMHLMTLVGIARPAALERLLIVLAKWIFYVGFFGRCLA
jgi:ubiquinol oxidase